MLNATRNAIDTSNELSQIAMLILQEDLHQGLRTTNLHIQYRHAQKTLINSRIKSEQLRSRETH
jgi:predicted thioesterase